LLANGWLFVWSLLSSDENSLADFFFFSLWGFVLAGTMSLGLFAYLGLMLALFKEAWSNTRGRLFAIAASPLIGVPWWYPTLRDLNSDPSFAVVIGVVCLAFGLTVRRPPAGESVRPASANTGSAFST